MKAAYRLALILPALMLLTWGPTSNSANNVISKVCTCKGSSTSPVCGRNKLPYENACQAKCAGTSVDYTGACGRKDKACDECYYTQQMWDPTCLVKSATTKKTWTYSNPCYASCKGGATSTSLYYKGTCQATCDAKCAKAAPDPVCCGSGVEYPNACYASCAGGLTADEVKKCSRGQCKGDQALSILMDACPMGAISAYCLRDPCQGETCPADRTAQCVSVYCTKFFRFEFLSSVCTAAWLNPASGNLVANCSAAP